MNYEYAALRERIRMTVIFLAIFAIIKILAPNNWIWYSLASIALFMAIITWLFLRNPKRRLAVSEKEIVAPADGKIVAIVEDRLPEIFGDEKLIRVSIFMSVFNVHINRMPVAGTIEDIIYNKGKFVSANLDKASTDNENNILVIRSENGEKVACKQIAGLIARRIVCFTRKNERLPQSGIFGLIRFGSRVDVFLPYNKAKITAQLGDKPMAGISILGEWI